MILFTIEINYLRKMLIRITNTNSDDTTTTITNLRIQVTNSKSR